MHRWFLVCCIIDNVNVKVRCVDLDRAALVWAVLATTEVWSVSIQASNISVEDKQATSVVSGALKIKRNY